MNQSKGKARPKTSKSKPIKARSAPYNMPGAPKTTNSTTTPVSFVRGSTSSDPKFSRTSRDKCVITHRELVGNILGQVNAFVTTFQINPGLSQSFPWLATQATGWEQYRFRKLNFEYETRCGTTTNGSYYAAIDYDAADAPPVSEIQISSYTPCINTAPYLNRTLSARKEQMSVVRYIRAAALSANQDIKTYDIGNLQQLVVDGSANTPWGKLWVDYEVELIQPQANPPPIATTIVSLSNTTASTSYLPNQPFGNANFSNVTSNLDSNVVPIYQFNLGYSGSSGAFSFVLAKGQKYRVSWLLDVTSSGLNLSGGSFTVSTFGIVNAVTSTLAGGTTNSMVVAVGTASQTTTVSVTPSFTGTVTGFGIVASVFTLSVDSTGLALI